MKLVEYQTSDGKSLFAEWFNGLDKIAAAKVTVATIRMGQGNLSNAKGVGAGVPHRLWAGLSGVFRQGRRQARYLAGWWHKETPEKGY